MVEANQRRREGRGGYGGHEFTGAQHDTREMAVECYLVLLVGTIFLETYENENASICWIDASYLNQLLRVLLRDQLISMLINQLDE